MSDGLRPGLSDLVVRNVGAASYGVHMTVIDTEDLDEESASGHVHGICLKTGPPRRVGVELEWLVRDARDPALPVPAGRIAAAITAFDADRGDPDEQEKRDEGNGDRPELPTSTCPGVLPSGALLTTEPGGQLELASHPADTLAALVAATGTDLAALRETLADAGLEITGIGLDPLRPPRRVLTLPRYAAMEAFFDRGGPVLVAAFANSPLREGRRTGWASSRQQVWTRMDPGRTRPPQLDGDPRADWAAYALDAQVMCVREPDSADWSAPPGLTFRDWVRAGPANKTEPSGKAPAGNGEADAWRLRRPTAGDLEYHLSTLFPPVRPRGHFELRMIDAQPGDGWIVPLAVSSALLSDAQAGEAALTAVAPLGDGLRDRDDGPWVRAARLGPADPAISQASRACFAAAREALDRTGAPTTVTAAVDA